MENFIFGIVFLIAADGELLEAPRIYPFEAMEQCQSIREEFKQYAAENLPGVEVRMACVPSEAFK